MIRSLFALAFLLSSHAALAQPCAGFLNAPLVQQPYAPNAVADLDSDGVPDLISASELTISFGRADGTYAQAVKAAPGHGGDVVVIADLNGDGLHDLFVSASQGGAVGQRSLVNVAVVYNLGGRRFSGVQQVSISATPPLVRDFTGDGRPDVLIVHPLREELLLVNDRGVLRLPVTSSEIGNPTQIAAGDVNGDARADVIAFNAPELRVFLGDGSGAFTPGPILSTDMSVHAIATADLDSDARADVIALSETSAEVRVHFGSGGALTLTTSQHPDRIVVADFNGDELDDFAVTTTDGTLVPFTSNGGGTVTRRATYGVVRSEILGASDFDGDGFIDLLAGGRRGHSVLFGNGDGTFRAAPRLDVPFTAKELQAADVDGDGFDELVMITSSNTLVITDADGTLLHSMPVGPGAALDTRGPVIAIGSGSEARVLTRNSDGTWSTRFTVGTPLSIQSIALVELTGDDAYELAIIQREVYFARLTVFRANGAPLLDTPISVEDSLHVRAADLNGDGHEDLVVTGGTNPSSFIPGPPSTGYLDFYAGTGSGTLLPVQHISGGELSIPMVETAIGDVNGDGIDDVITMPALIVHFGVRSGTPRMERFFPPGDSAFPKFAVGDINGDRIDDVVTSDGDLVVYLGTRDGFTERGPYLAGRPALAGGTLPIIAGGGPPAIAHIEPGVRRSIVVPTAAGFLAPRMCSAGRTRAVRH